VRGLPKGGKCMGMKKITQVAYALYDGGWRAEDADQLQEEYNFSSADLADLVLLLQHLAAKNQ